MAKFSVSICTYGGDKPNYLDEALNSIYNQTRKPDEVVLTVDGPVPEEIDIVIEKYEKQYGMKVYRLPQNQGHGKARNFGMSKCSYEYIAIADSDDINVNTRFEKQMDIVEADTEISVVGTAACHFSGSIEDISFQKKQHVLSNEEIYEKIKTRCPVINASVMLKKCDVEKVGGYQDWYHAEDYYLWVRMALAGCKFVNTPEMLLYIRTDDKQIKRRGGYKYFKSISKLYRFMLKNKLITFSTYLYNVISRFVLQVLCPNKIRGFLRKKLL